MEVSALLLRSRPPRDAGRGTAAPCLLTPRLGSLGRPLPAVQSPWALAVLAVSGCRCPVWGLPHGSTRLRVSWRGQQDPSLSTYSPSGGLSGGWLGFRGSGLRESTGQRLVPGKAGGQPVITRPPPHFSGQTRGRGRPAATPCPSLRGAPPGPRLAECCGAPRDAEPRGPLPVPSPPPLLPPVLSAACWLLSTKTSVSSGPSACSPASPVLGLPDLPRAGPVLGPVPSRLLG